MTPSNKICFDLCVFCQKKTKEKLKDPVLKGEGGIIGKFDNQNALLRWLVAGPEIAAVISEFENEFQLDPDSLSLLHHEQSKSFQLKFLDDVKSLISSLNENGNPFDEECKELITLKSRVIIGKVGDTSARSAKTAGEKQYQEFVEKRLVKKTVDIADPIVLNQFSIFKEPKKKKQPTNSVKIKGLKADLALVSKLFIATQTRSGDLNEFFQFENQPFPPALSINGTVRTGNKADILKCLQKCYVVNHTLSKPITSCTILDGPAIVNIVRPFEVRTFGEYALQKFQAYIRRHYNDQTRVDILFDVYKADSLKALLRQKRGDGKRQLIRSNITLPAVWSTFLRVDENKKELFNFLAKEITLNSGDWDQLIICTVENNAISNKSFDLCDVSPCDHEESDSRIIVHLKHAVNCGHESIMIQTVDSDVVVLAVWAVNEINNLTELWVAFGTGKHFRYIPAHEIAATLGPSRTSVLPFFRAFTGADLVSFFFGIGKKTAWDLWMAEIDFEYTECFHNIITKNGFDDADLKVIEKFVVRLYDKKSNLESVNQARKYMFPDKTHFESIPPTVDSLKEHLKRSIYQASLIWCRSTEKNLNLPSPLKYGWKTSGTGYEPYWTSAPPIALSCKQLIKCGCTKGCIKTRCTCLKGSLQCTSLCKCKCLEEQ